MSNTIKAQFEIILGALAAIGREFIGESPEQPAPSGDPATPATGRRGRPPKADPATAPAETAAAPAGTKAPEPAKDNAPSGMSLEELRAIIEKPVKDGDGEAVKTIIKKYVPGGGTLKDLAGLPQHHEDFKKDISALSI